jgi:hypothetical protein
MLNVAMDFCTCGMKIEHFGIPAKIIHPKNRVGRRRDRDTKKFAAAAYDFNRIFLRKQKKHSVI